MRRNSVKHCSSFKMSLVSKYFEFGSAKRSNLVTGGQPYKSCFETCFILVPIILILQLAKKNGLTLGLNLHKSACVIKEVKMTLKTTLRIY